MNTGRSGHSALSDPQLCGYRLDIRLVLRVLLVREASGFVLDVDCYLGECLRVFPPVVGAKKQLTRVWEQDADVRLRTTAIAEIQGGERPGGGYSSGHVAFLVSCPPGLAVRPALGWLPTSYSTAQHIPRRQASPSRVVYATSENRGRVISGERPVRFTLLLPFSHDHDTLPGTIPLCGTSRNRAERAPTTPAVTRETTSRRCGMRAKAAWLAASTRQGTLPFE
jgi:hypothetical protein